MGGKFELAFVLVCLKYAFIFKRGMFVVRLLNLYHSYQKSSIADNIGIWWKLFFAKCPVVSGIKFGVRIVAKVRPSIICFSIETRSVSKIRYLRVCDICDHAFSTPHQKQKHIYMKYNISV